MAHIVNDLDWHSRGLRSKSAAQLEAFKADLHKDGVEVARELEKSKQNQARLARRRFRSNSSSSTSSDSTVDHDVQNGDHASDENLFDNSSPQASAPTTFSPSN